MVALWHFGGCGSFQSKHVVACSFWRPYGLFELQSRAPGRGVEIRKSPKVVRRGCKRSSEPRERKASCTGATPGCTGAKQGCTWCTRLLGDLGAVGPQDLLRPLLTTFGDFPIFDPSPRRSGLQSLNAMLSLLHPLGNYRIDKECDWEALSRPISHPHRGRSSQSPCSKSPF